MVKKNILGEGFPKYVRDQVKIRQAGLGENPISNASVIKNDGKTSWIKLASSVNLNSEAQRELNITANLPENIESENYAARSLVLYNGTTNTFFNAPRSGVQGPYIWQGDIFNSDSGVKIGSGKVSDEGGAYGFGGFEQGAVPMPGIMNFKVTPRNRGGIRDATINIQANNIRQFQLLESLYLRLGYHVLIEWGWDTYYDNEGNLVVTDQTQSPVLSNFLRSDKSEYYRILDLINVEKEKSNGNYDALLGRVVNFQWTLRDGGGYDISIRVLSAGDILDSLTLPNLPASELAITNAKLNEEDFDGKSNSNPDAISATELAQSPEATKSTIHRWLWLIKHMLTPNLDADGNVVNVGVSGNKTLRDFYQSVYQKDFGILPDISQRQGGNNTVLDLAFNTTYMYLTNLVPKMNARYEVPTSYGTARAPRIGAWYASFRTEQAAGTEEGNTYDYYINFGNLLGFISKTLMYYNQDTEQPVIDIDFDLNKNLCYTFPIVPTICDVTTLSINDNICLVNGYVNTTEGIKSLWPGIFPLQDEPFNEGSTQSHGRIMAINLHMDFVKSCADSAYDNVDHTINLNKFLDAILNGINSCFYGTVNLVTQIDPDTNILYILDLSQIPDIESLGVDTTQTKFRVSGFNLGEASFLKSINITSEISKNIANQLVIGAQQSGNVISNVPTGLTAFNKGYTDRVFTKRLDSYQTNKNQELAQAQADRAAELARQQEIAATKLFLRQYALFKIYIRLALANKLPSDTNSAKYYDVVESMIKWMLSQITSDLPTVRNDSGEVELQGQNPPGYIPISLNIEMEGLAGMKLFNKFTISEEYLPFSYRNQFDFIIKGITHEVRNNYWTTQIESLCVPKPRNVIGTPTQGGPFDFPDSSITPSNTPKTRTNTKCATDPNDNFGRLVGSEEDIPTPWNKKYSATEIKNIIYTLFRVAGFTQAQAAVALGNAQGESNFNNLAIGDSCQSYGLFQLHTVGGAGKSALRGDYQRRGLLINFTSRYELFDPYINTLIILTSAAAQGLQNDKDIAEATVTFVNKVERPADKEGERKKRAIFATNLANYKVSGADAINVLNNLQNYKFTYNGGTFDGIEVLSNIIRFYGLQVPLNASDASDITQLRSTYGIINIPSPKKRLFKR
jgi:hypothetical protein